MLVFWDTNLFIYLLESHGDLTLLTRALWERMLLRGDRLVTSSMTLGELLSGTDPGRPEVALAARRWLDQFATVRSFDSEAAVRYAAIRRDRTVRPPDAIQLACAAEAGATLFVTNDDRLSRKVVPGVPVLSSLRSVPI